MQWVQVHPQGEKKFFSGVIYRVSYKLLVHQKGHQLFQEKKCTPEKNPV